MTKHKDMKNFSDKLKNEEAALSKMRNITKPEITELSSITSKIPTTLLPDAISLDLPSFIDLYSKLATQIIDDAKEVNAKSSELHKS
jgi:hypothetical protein